MKKHPFQGLLLGWFSLVRVHSVLIKTGICAEVVLKSTVLYISQYVTLGISCMSIDVAILKLM